MPHWPRREDLQRGGPGRQISCRLCLLVALDHAGIHAGAGAAMDECLLQLAEVGSDCGRRLEVQETRRRCSSSMGLDPIRERLVERQCCSLVCTRHPPRTPLAVHHGC
uniref:Uncharacterized protein n=1 Tax=Arundo donax TaxID=35708 RepID=A0A0A9F2A6_ARUDO